MTRIWKGGDWGVLEKEATGILTKDADPDSRTLVDACNYFNKLIGLAMICTVCHRWPAGAMFAFNCYRN